ncbi:hypothetical protein BGW42_006960, partial [Actinomortierella wolfii]
PRSVPRSLPLLLNQLVLVMPMVFLLRPLFTTRSLPTPTHSTQTASKLFLLTRLSAS